MNPSIKPTISGTSMQVIHLRDGRPHMATGRLRPWEFQGREWMNQVRLELDGLSHIYIYVIHIYGLWLDWTWIFMFSIYWEFHNPNWLIFFSGVETTNQMTIIDVNQLMV